MALSLSRASGVPVRSLKVRLQEQQRAQNALLQGVADGEITPSEAAELSKLVEAHTKAIEAADFAKRLAALEQAAGGKR